MLIGLLGILCGIVLIKYGAAAIIAGITTVLIALGLKAKSS